MDRKRTISSALLVLYFAAVCLLCFMKFDSGIDFSTKWFGLPKDKVVHFMMFLPYPALVYGALYRKSGKAFKFIVFMATVIIAGITIAGATELIQGMTDYRSADIYDLRADSLGILAGSTAVMIYATVSKKL